MNLICSRCQTTNEGDAHFCKTCGTGFNVKPIRKNSIVTPVMIIIAVVAVCAVCGLFGLIGGNNKPEVAQSNTWPARQFTTNASSSETNGIDDSPVKPTVQIKSGQGATVISENANLRQSPSAGGEVIQTLPQNSPVEIIRQKGAWFYVRARDSIGWMHSNTIRLDEANLTESPAPVPPPVYTASKPRMEPPAATINNSGASAKCRDGSLSYSQNRRGTCSHHGGVAVWY